MSFTRRNLLLLAAAIGLAAGPAIAIAAGRLNVGSYPNNPPFEFKAESGNFEGFEVDIVTEAAKRAGMNVNIAGYDFQPLFAATSSGRIDVAISSITITQGAPGLAVLHPALLRCRHGHRRKEDSDDQGPGRPEGQDRRRAVRLDRRDMGQGASGCDGFSEVKGYNAQQDVLLDLTAGRVDAVSATSRGCNMPSPR